MHTRSGPRCHPAGSLTQDHNVPTVELEQHTLPPRTVINESGHTAYGTKQKHQHLQTQVVQGHNASAMHIRNIAEQAWKGHAQPDTLTEREGLKTRQRRKFMPQLVETASRSVRGTSISQHTSSYLLESELESPQPVDAMKNVSHGHGLSTVPESSFSYLSLQRRYATRRHSFRVPDLPVIPSSCSGSSDESEVDCLSPVPSKKPFRRRSNYGHTLRESCDEEISSYLLSLAAQAAEQQLKEQALAAFPNEQVYQPVDHFAIDEDEARPHDEVLSLSGQLQDLNAHRKSPTDPSSGFDCLSFYKQRARMRLASTTGTDGNLLRRAESFHRHPAGHQGSMDVGTSSEVVQKGPPTSPPMLGGDLIFPQSSSPQTTIYQSGDSFQSAPKTYENPGLWSASPHFDDREGDGLWMGTCKNNTRTELMPIPVHNMQESMSVPTGGMSTCVFEDLGTSNPLAGKNKNDVRDTVMNEDNDEPYLSDEFVTQIYNYLSLGYPCVARYYDHELSKVSGIPILKLRQDDKSIGAKGFFVEEEITKRDKMSYGCMRWHALRLYIREWGSQRPCIPEEDGNHEKWGVRERRGSWAI